MSRAACPQRLTTRLRRARAAAPLAALVLAAAMCDGGDGGGANGEQVASTTTSGGAWHLEYTVEESGVHEIAMAPSSGGDPVKSRQHYHFTCTGSARLSAEEESEDTFEGPATTHCDYGADGEFTMNVWREKMTGTGTPDTTTLTASLSLDREHGTYMVAMPTPSFTVVQTHSGATCQGDPEGRGCHWESYTKVDSSGVSGTRPSFDDQPYSPNATSMHGSSSGPFEDLGPGMTRHVSWTLSLAEPPKRDAKTLAVTIEGPPCACLDGERVPGTPVTWVATASRGGGTFGAIQVASSGPAPRVVESTAGADGARITLEPTRETGAVTLTATYTLDGHETTATRDVSFCVMDSLKYPEDARDFAFDKSEPGVLEVAAQARALYNGTDASRELAWTFEPIGAASTTKREPARPVGASAHVRYVGLPELAAAFGPKSIDAALTKGSCACARHGRFRAFFSPTATNHPPAGPGVAPGESPSPNWYFYYSQTQAISGVPDVRYARSRFSRRDNRPAIAQFDEDDGHIYLTDLLWKSVCRRAVAQGGKPVAATGAGNDGIDCVAESTRHEAQHRADWSEWWPHGYIVAVDPDLDGVPIPVERAHPGCSATKAASCDERPFTDVGDREINAYWVGWRWTTGALNAQDWACGPKGKQWTDGYGCSE